jgi:hypothetical protein
MSDLLLFAFLVFSPLPSSQTHTDMFSATDTVTGAAPLDDFNREWYSKHLVAMGESRLPEGLAARGETLASHRDRRGARIARRDDPEYRAIAEGGATPRGGDANRPANAAQGLPRGC